MTKNATARAQINPDQLPKLTIEQERDVRTLMTKGGYSQTEAVIIVTKPKQKITLGVAP